MPEKDLTPSDSFGTANFADADNGGGPALERIRDRLSQDRGPSTAASTSKWKSGSELSMLHSRTPDATKVSLSDLEQMRRDPMLAFGLSFIKSYLAKAEWHIKSSDARRAAFVDAALRRIYGRFILQWGGCLDFGYQGLVKNFERANVDWTYIDKSKNPDGEEVEVWPSSAPPLIWKPFTALNPRNTRPSFNKAGDFNGITHNLIGGSGAYFPFELEKRDPSIPLEWAMWATNEKDSVFGSLYGYPRTAYAYRYWWAFWFRFGLADRAFEKWADPPVIAYHPVEIATDDEGNVRNFTTEALGLAERLRSGANVSLPSTPVESLVDGHSMNLRQWELTQMKSEANFDAINESFHYLDVAKLRALLIPEQSLIEGGGGTSSRNVASQMGDMFEESQAVIKTEIDDHINRYMIPQLLDANFGPGGPSCEIVTTGFQKQDIETARAIVQAFAQNAPAELAGIDFRELLERLGVPLLTPAQERVAQEELLKNIAAMKPSPQNPGAGLAQIDEEGRYVTPAELDAAVETIRIGLSQEVEDHSKRNLRRLANAAGKILARREKEEAPQPEPIVLAEAEEQAEERALGLMEKFFDFFRQDRKAQELVIRVSEEDEDDSKAA